MELLWPQAANSPHCMKKIYDLPDSHLNRLKPCIRILKLHPGASNDPIECTLQAANLDDDNADYEAISYVWGDAGTTSSILVNGENFNVTVNLKDALQCLRLPECDRLLWADAVCIDQSSFEEKISHLSIMGRIYRDAKQVHIWLDHLSPSWLSEAVQDKDERAEWVSIMEKINWPGMDIHLRRSLLRSFNEADTPPPASASPYEEILDVKSPLERLDLFLEALADDAHLFEFPFYGFGEDRLMTPCSDADGDEDEYDFDDRNTEFNTEWTEVAQILLWVLSRPWWTRVWTLQEVLLPHVVPTIHIGSKEIPISKLFGALENAKKHQVTCCKPFQSVWLGKYSQTIGRLILRTHDLSQMRVTVQENKAEASDHILVIFESSDRQATDIRDHIYGILGLTDPGFSMLCQYMAYRQTAVELFTFVTKLFFYSQSSLNMLTFTSGSKKTRLPGLPSWAIDFRHVLEDIDVLCEGEPLCKACLDIPFDGTRILHDIQRPTVQAKGIRIGKVGNCAKMIPGSDGEADLAPLQARSLIKEAMKMYKAANKDPSLYDENRFWRTILRDSTYTEHEPEPPEPPLCLDLVKKWWEELAEYEIPADPAGLKRWEKGYEDCGGNFLTASREIVRLSFRAWKKSRFFCTENGEPGLGPKEMELYDEVYVLAGFKGLMVMRRRSEDTYSLSSTTPSYTIRGACYIDGFMEGQAVRGDPQWEDLILY